MRKWSSRKVTASAAVLLTIAVLVGPNATAAYAAPPAAKLSFTTTAQSLTAGVTSNMVTIQIQANNGSPVNASSNVTVTLTKSSSGGLFRNSTDTATITSVTIPTGANSASFKYRDTLAGTATITASASGLSSAVQNETVAAAALDHIAISPKTSTIAPTGSQGYAVTAFDQFNNGRGNVTGSTTFAISPDGSCNNATASCTATSSGAHTVTATFTGKSDTATLTVVSSASTLAFTTVAQALTAGVASGVITVQLQTSTGTATNAASDVTVSLVTGSPGGTFRNSADTATITTVTIASGTNSASFKYRDTRAGTASISASSTGLTSATQDETVSAAALDHIAIAPKNATVAAGVGQAYTATGFDLFDNSRGDVTSATTFTIAPNGSCSGATCQATAPGTHTVTGTDAGKTDTATLTVSAGGPASITISPKKSSVLAGAFQTYTVGGADQFGNSLGDVTGQTTFTIAPGGTCVANQCTATIVGIYTVTATNGTAVAQATLTIKPAALDHIVLDPADATIASGGSQSYTAEAFDVYGNSRGDITSVTTFTITPDGSCNANVCTASVAGSHTVRGVRGSKSGTAILHVSLGGTAWIAISPAASAVTAGGSVTYTAQAFDSSGNPLGDVTADTTFTISPDGSCTADSCTSTTTGPHTVTGTDGSFTDDADLTVNPAALDHIIVTPQDSTIGFGDSQTYASTGYDVYGNSRGDLTSGTTFTITPDGSCSANVCTPAAPGLHSVKGQRGGAIDTASLHVGGATPTIASISPTTGKVGGSVIVTGGGFTGATDVAFGGLSTTFVVDSDTQITATVPMGALTGKITVVAPGGTAVSTATFKVQPSITGFTPASGPVGTTVVITGTAFTGATAVTFNGLPATTFTVDSYSQITATVPCCGASGKIKVTTPGGNGSSPSSFKVPASISGFSPGSGPVGTTVVITGVAFTGTTAVAFGGIAAVTFTVDSDTQITVVVPAGATTGKIKVTTGGGSVSSSTNFTVTP